MLNLLSVTAVVGATLMAASWFRIRRLATVLPEQPAWMFALGLTIAIAIARCFFATPNYLGLLGPTSSLIALRILMALVGIHLAVILTAAMKMISARDWAWQRAYVYFAVLSGFLVAIFVVQGVVKRQPNFVDFEIWFGSMAHAGGLGTAVLIIGHVAVLLRAALGPRERRGPRNVIIFGVLFNILAFAHDATVVLGDNENPYLSVAGMIVLVLCLSVAAELLIHQRHIELSREAALAEERYQVQHSFLTHLNERVGQPMEEIRALRSAINTAGLQASDEVVTGLNSASGMLSNLIADLKDFESLEAGVVQIQAEPFEPVLVFQDLRGVASYLPQNSNCVTRWTTNCPPTLTLMGDAKRINQIAMNLISNAKKFTEQGTVEVAVQVIPRAQNCRLAVIVSDTGIGIDEDQINEVFESFTQRETGLSRRFEGSGLGLAISRQLAELMGGTLEAKRRPNGGMTFTFAIELPTVIDESSTQAPAGPFRLLVVDDSSTYLMAVTHSLQAMGHIVTPCASGPEAIKALMAEHHHIVLTDMQMRPWSGEETLDAIRRAESDGALAHRGAIPVIALSGDEYHEDSQFFDHLAKTNDATLMAAAIERALRFAPSATESA